MEDKELLKALSAKQAELQAVNAELVSLWEKDDPNITQEERDREHVLDTRSDELCDEITALQEEIMDMDDPVELDPRPICT